MVYPALSGVITPLLPPPAVLVVPRAPEWRPLATNLSRVLHRFAHNQFPNEGFQGTSTRILPDDQNQNLSVRMAGDTDITVLVYIGRVLWRTEDEGVDMFEQIIDRSMQYLVRRGYNGPTPRLTCHPIVLFFPPTVRLRPERLR